MRRLYNTSDASYQVNANGRPGELVGTPPFSANCDMVFVKGGGNACGIPLVTTPSGIAPHLYHNAYLSQHTQHTMDIIFAWGGKGHG